MQMNRSTPAQRRKHQQQIVPLHQNPILASESCNETFVERFWAKVNKNGPIPDAVKYPNLLTPCWVWTAYRNRPNYGLIKCGPKNGPTMLAHRASWILHHGQIPDGLHVLHHCDNPVCVNALEHLWLGTDQDNATDCTEKGRRRGGGVSGERHYLAKLTDEKVKQIRLLRTFETIRELSKRFGVSPMTIHHAIHKVTWKHV